MITRTDDGRTWHRGTRIGFAYAVAMAILLAFFGAIGDDAPPALVWLKKLDGIIVLVPIAAASQAYVAGLRDEKSGKPA